VRQRIDADTGQQMRILILCAAFPPSGRGGGPVSSLLLAKGLLNASNQVRVVTVGDAENFEIKEGLEVVTITSPNVYWDYYRENHPVKKAIWHLFENFNPRAYHRARKEIAAYNPDIMLTISIENVNVASWLAAYSEGLPCVHLLHSYFLMCWRGSMFRHGKNCRSCKSCKIFSAGKKFFSRYVDGVVGETEFVVDLHIKDGYFLNAKPYVIPGAVETLGTVALSERAINRTLRVGFIGTHTRNKGIETLAAAARRLAPNPEIRFIIAGSGEEDYTSGLKRLFPGENTDFVGWTTPSDFFSQIDVVVVPSVWREPFGRVSVEGMGFGVPAVVASSGGLPENVQEGINGLIFESFDDAGLSRILLRLYTDRSFLRKLAQGASASASKYNQADVADAFSSCLQDVHQRKRAREMRRRSRSNT
jgi:glycosyltransferase involved in cell wall biosynthesis